MLHDCGKVDVQVVDEDGRCHYPDHAAKSAEVAATLFAENPELSESERALLVDLIANDMLFHVGTREQVADTSKTLATLLAVTALCEIHANAAMFGGIESTSFKIKWKKWEKLVRGCLLDSA